MQQEHWQIKRERDALEREYRAKLRKEEKDRLRAMDPNKSKSMSPEEKDRAINAFKNRRWREHGIGHVPGEWS